MNLLEKFDSVKIEADKRISETDKGLCEAHQAAYEAALEAFKELIYFREDMENQQYRLMEMIEKSYQTRYLSSHDGPSFSVEALRKHIEHLHGILISAIVNYFNQTYHITVDAKEVQSAVLPKKPEHSRYDHTDEWKQYHQDLQELVVSYKDVVDQIILRMDGRGFAEQAFYELQTLCHNAAWNNYDRSPRFERKKATIQFNSYSCSCDTWYGGGPRWKLSDKTKDIMRGVAHFETGCYNVLPLGIGDLLGYRDLETDVVEFPSCQKVKQVKMFKKGRVDLKFHTESDAAAFITTYLGTAP